MTREPDPHRLRVIQRRRWARKLLRPLPRRANVGRYPVIKWFAAHARRAPFLWSFKRANVLPALYGGAILALLPLYGFQFIAAFGLALLLRANLTVTVGLQFITNPLTIIPIYGFTRYIGAHLMSAIGVGDELGPIMRGANALFVGGVAVGFALALVADIVWRIGAWEARRFRSRHERLATPGSAPATADTAPPGPDPVPTGSGEPDDSPRPADHPDRGA